MRHMPNPHLPVKAATDREGLVLVAWLTLLSLSGPVFAYMLLHVFAL